MDDVDALLAEVEGAIGVRGGSGNIAGGRISAIPASGPAALVSAGRAGGFGGEYSGTVPRPAAVAHSTAGRGDYASRPSASTGVPPGHSISSAATGTTGGLLSNGGGYQAGRASSSAAAAASAGGANSGDARSRNASSGDALIDDLLSMTNGVDSRGCALQQGGSGRALGQASSAQAPRRASADVCSASAAPGSSRGPSPAGSTGYPADDAGALTGPTGSGKCSAVYLGAAIDADGAPLVVGQARPGVGAVKR
jgi:hypothetical protein